MDIKLIGTRIRELRQERGITQGELAKALMISYQAVSNWERGVAPPDLENLIRIASYFGVLTDDLLHTESAHKLCTSGNEYPFSHFETF